MAYIVADRIQETTATSGTGDLSLAGAVTTDGGYKRFSTVMTVGDTCDYCIKDATANAWEVGLGTYSAANTLTRTTVYASSNSNTLVNLAGNSSTTVFITLSANRAQKYVGPGSPLSFCLSFPAGAIVAAGTYTLCDEAPYAMLISNLRYQVGTASGSFSVAINNGGTVVSGLSAVSVSSSTRATASATANTSVAIGNRIEAVISSVSGSPTGATLTLNGVRT